MSRILVIISFSLAFPALIWVSVFRRRSPFAGTPRPLLHALSLMLLGIVVGTFPRAVGWQNEGVLIGSSIASLVANLSAFVILIRIRKS